LNFTIVFVFIRELNRSTVTCTAGREYELITEAHAKTFRRPNLLQILSSCVSGGGETAGGQEVVSSNRGWGEEGGGQTVHRERESGAVSNDRKLSVGFCY
jgi:hypothetical protein